MIPVFSFVFLYIILFLSLPYLQSTTERQPSSPSKKVYDIIFSLLWHMDKFPHFINLAAKVQKIFDMCKENQRFSIRNAVFCVSVLCRSSLGCESVIGRWRSGRMGEGIITN